MKETTQSWIAFFHAPTLALKWTDRTTPHNARLPKLQCFPGTSFKTQKQLKENLNKPSKQWKKSQSKEQNLN